MLRARSAVVTLITGMVVGWLAAAGCASAHKELELPLIMQAWGIIQDRYVDRSAVEPRTETYGAIAGMVEALGDTGHTTFLTPAMVKALKQADRGELKGIGVEIQRKAGQVVVVAPLDDSPAQHAGLRAGDIILKINGHADAGWPLSRVAEHITGPPGTWVHLTVLSPRGGRTREVAVMRADIKMHEVTWQRLPGTAIIHLRIASFDAGVTRDLSTALATIQHQGARGIVLDLRDNPGGRLDEAVGVASQFLTGGDVLLVKNAKGHIRPVPVRKGGLAPKTPLVTLINSGTASAAEIVAGALRDAHRAELVGETTFGTGTVLEQFGLADGSALLLAVEEWLTPDGHSFWHKGIAPQLRVALPADATPLFPPAERSMTPQQLQDCGDNQLLRALKVLEQSAERS